MPSTLEGKAYTHKLAQKRLVLFFFTATAAVFETDTKMARISKVHRFLRAVQLTEI